MTDQKPQQEYIITEDQLDRVERCYVDSCDQDCPNAYCPIDIGKAIRLRKVTRMSGGNLLVDKPDSRPAPSPLHNSDEIWKKKIEEATRNATLDALKKDLQTRFIPSTNQWSKVWNSGLLECCNIIDESLQRQAGDPK